MTSVIRRLGPREVISMYLRGLPRDERAMVTERVPPTIRTVTRIRGRQPFHRGAWIFRPGGDGERRAIHQYQARPPARCCRNQLALRAAPCLVRYPRTQNRPTLLVVSRVHGAERSLLGAMAVTGWRATGVDRDIHLVMGFALNGGRTSFTRCGPASGSYSCCGRRAGFRVGRGRTGSLPRHGDGSKRTLRRITVRRTIRW